MKNAESTKHSRKKEKNHVSDEVFFTASGTPIEVEYHSYPQFKNGKISGAVVTFLDIRDRRKKEEEIEYLNCHDQLTGLYNRRCFEIYSQKLDSPDKLPLAAIFADLNGLKMTNDIFGHAAGDQLIRKSSEILKHVCRQDDLVARVGGDEFIVILPRTGREEAEKIMTRIRAGFKDAKVAAIKCSISLGLEIKENVDQDLEEIITNAENDMYKDKTNNRKAINKDIIDTILDTLQTRYPEEKEHSRNVSELSWKTGREMGLRDMDLHKLKTTGNLHDIGKIVIDQKILKNSNHTPEELEIMRQHPVYGYRILSLFDDMLDIAEYVYSHHERWDGKGYPKGLKEDQIPLLSRIIAVAETYDRVLNRDGKGNMEQARQVIEEGEGSRFDPIVCEAFLYNLDKTEEDKLMEQ